MRGKQRQLIGITGLVMALALVLSGTRAAASPVVYAAYDDLLRRFVDDEGMVDYAGLKQESAKLEAVVDAFAAVTRATFDAWSKDDQLAFLINVYNVNTLALIVRRYPVDSIKRLSKPWDRREWSVLGEQVSLNEIEHQLIRKNYDEPRIHFALVCAAVGCPPLQARAWTGDDLEQRFSRPLARFLDHPDKYRVDRENRVVYLSPLFKWYGEDFSGSEPPPGSFGKITGKLRGVLGFIARHRPADEARFLRSGDYAVRFLDYSWKLNEQRD